MEVQWNLGFVLVRDLAEVLLGQLAEVSVVDAASAGQDHPGSLVVGLDEVREVVPVDGLDVLGGTEDRAAKRGSLM